MTDDIISALSEAVFGFDDAACARERLHLPQDGKPTARKRQLVFLLEALLAKNAETVELAGKYATAMAVVDKNIREDIHINIMLQAHEADILCTDTKMPNVLSDGEKEKLAAEIEALLFPNEKTLID